ncbi:MAG TPA: hypothetical protein VGN11_12715 [Candidatus Baltobacteraceae bacterium]|jgi:glycosyltransferase involved in cell wall biosynthesis|nr:hypothetical protein [Candidatus Baltobacteraceae bacterium]
MRLHNRFSYLWPRYDEPFTRETLRPDALVAARFEPVYSIRYEAYMDCLFERNGNWLVVPMVRVDGVSVMVPENPPLSWPSIYGSFDAKPIAAVESLVLPWLRSITTARLVNNEFVRFFKDTSEFRSIFDRARAASWLGAAPYADVLRAVAPSAYALRLARGKRIALRGEQAPNHAAILSTVAARTDIDSGDADRDDAARRWFGGLELARIDAFAAYDVYVGPREGSLEAPFAVFTDTAVPGERRVSVAEPIPTDVMISFDIEDAPETTTFAVREGSVALREFCAASPPVGGGSGGRIRLVVRDEAARCGDADADAAKALAQRLCAEGFDAEVSIASKVDVSKADIIHVFDLRHGVALVELLRDADAARVPIVVTPYADDRKNEAIAGSSGAILIPRCSPDTVAFEDYAWAFARRKISNLSQGEWYDEAASTLMARAAALIVSVPAEGAFVRERFNSRGAIIPVPATIPLDPPSAQIASLVGPDEFILVHGPIEPRMNQLFAALAAERERLPLVVLGPVAEIEYSRYLNEVVGPRVTLLRDHDLSPAEIAGIYRRARVMLDISWSSRGLHRLARGAASGSAIVASSNGYARDLWGDLVVTVDPAALDAIGSGIRRAWDRQPEISAAIAAKTAERCDPFAGLVAIVSAYQQAAALPA